MKKSVIFEIWNRRDGRNTGDASMDVWERSVEQGEKCSERIFNRRISIRWKSLQRTDRSAFTKYITAIQNCSEVCQKIRRKIMKKMMQEMEVAGINAITEEVNNQLDQWYNTVR